MTVMNQNKFLRQCSHQNNHRRQLGILQEIMLSLVILESKPNTHLYFMFTLRENDILYLFII